MQGRKFFLNVMKGAFMERPEAGKQTHTFQTIKGHIINITFKTTDWGEAMRLHIIDEHNFYMLSMFTHSRAANAFFMIAKNLDLTAEMELRIQAKDGKDYFSIHQYFGPVLWYYTVENAGELPRSPEDKKDYLVNMVKEELLPVIQRKLNPYPTNTMYRPMKQGIGTDYFEGNKRVGRTPGPISSFEKKSREIYGNNRPL